MTLTISPHAYIRLRHHGIMPGEADAVVADPEWCGTRLDGTQVLCRGGLVVIVRGRVIVTAYPIKKGESGNGQAPG